MCDRVFQNSSTLLHTTVHRLTNQRTVSLPEREYGKRIRYYSKRETDEMKAILFCPFNRNFDPRTSARALQGSERGSLSIVYITWKYLILVKFFLLVLLNGMKNLKHV